MRKIAWVLALVAGNALAQQDAVQVSFGKVEAFSDFGDSRWDRERNEREFAAMLREVAAKLPPGQQLSIKVLDVNLAGELEWIRAHADRLRVMRNITWPIMEFEFQLSQGTQVLKSGTVRLTDMAYLDSSHFSAAQDANGAFRYERRLLDRWFKATVLGGK
jgi:Protein of unknown function (DUF3016)